MHREREYVRKIKRDREKYVDDKERDKQREKEIERRDIVV